MTKQEIIIPLTRVSVRKNPQKILLYCDDYDKMLDHPTALCLFIYFSNLKAVSNKYSEDNRRWRFQGCEQDHRNFGGNTCLYGTGSVPLSAI